MVQGLVVKLLFNKIMEKLEKASDKKIASSHEKRLNKIEKKLKNCKCTK